MSLKLTAALANAMGNTGGIKELLDGGNLYFFAGPIPATADAALDMVTDHTEVAKFTVSNDGVTGLTFGAPVARVVSKTSSEAWQAETAFDGAEDAEATLVITFYRFCPAGDNGRGAADGTTGYRIQGTIGDLLSGADLVMNDPEKAEGVLLPINSFGWRVGPAA